MSKVFRPRTWQEAFVKKYRYLKMLNFMLEACTGAGKTAGSLNAYKICQLLYECRFLVVIAPTEHLKQQFAKDARDLFDMTLYYSGTDPRLGKLPEIESLTDVYDGMVLSYQFLTKSNNALNLRKDLAKHIEKKIFVILDEVHHVATDKAYEKGVVTAFPDKVVFRRLMTTGTAFRSDDNKILGKWVNYVDVGDNIYECKPDFRYTLGNAAKESVIPYFSIVTVDGKFSYERKDVVYNGRTFGDAGTEQEKKDIFRTALHPEGDFVKKAILWAYEQMQGDRLLKLYDSATYVRAKDIAHAFALQKRIEELTEEKPLIIVSESDEINDGVKSPQDNSSEILNFAAERGKGSRSWIIGVDMLGEGVSIPRLKYGLRLTNKITELSVRQDIGRLLRPYPVILPEPVQFLFPAHAKLIEIAKNILQEIPHRIRKKNSQAARLNNNGNGSRHTGKAKNQYKFKEATGDIASHIVEGEIISDLDILNLAEWAMKYNDLYCSWNKTPAHLAQLLRERPNYYKLLLDEYNAAKGKNVQPIIASTENIPSDFPSGYARMLPDQKAQYASKRSSQLAKNLAFKLKSRELGYGKTISKIFDASRKANQVPLGKQYISHEKQEEIYLWLKEANVKVTKGQINNLEEFIKHGESVLDANSKN